MKAISAVLVWFLLLGAGFIDGPAIDYYGQCDYRNRPEDNKDCKQIISPSDARPVATWGPLDEEQEQDDDY